MFKGTHRENLIDFIWPRNHISSIKKNIYKWCFNVVWIKTHRFNIFTCEISIYNYKNFIHIDIIRPFLESFNWSMLAQFSLLSLSVLWWRGAAAVIAATQRHPCTQDTHTLHPLAYLPTIVDIVFPRKLSGETTGSFSPQLFTLIK